MCQTGQLGQREAPGLIPRVLGTGLRAEDDVAELGPQRVRAELRKDRVLGTAVQPAFSSCRSPQAALKCLCRGDRVARDGPVGLRVRAAQTETRNAPA